MQHKNIKENERRVFALGDIAKELKIKKFVLRNWEKEFNFSYIDDTNGKRFYSDKEVEFFVQIKKLLYQEGLSLEDARKKLGITKKEQEAEKTTVAAKQGARIAPKEVEVDSAISDDARECLQYLEEVKFQLKALKKRLDDSNLVIPQCGKRERVER